MSGLYRIFGSEMSPYSVKVRSYFRYKTIPHAWIPRRADSEDEYRRLAKLPIVPTVATPDDEGLQDSTPILEALEARFPEPSIHPADPALAFLSALIEEFGDEWGNKLMFHHRWFADIDAEGLGPDAGPARLAASQRRRGGGTRRGGLGPDVGPRSFRGLEPGERTTDHWLSA